MNLFSALANILEVKLHALLSAYITLFADKMVTLITIGLPILVAYYGYSILAGRGSNATLGEMFWNVARIGIILSFIENSGGLLDASIALIHELKGSFVGAESVWLELDEVVGKTQNLSEIIKNLDPSVFKIEGSIASFLVWLGSAISIASAAIVFIAAEVGIALLVTTAPIFIGLMAYGFSKELFNGWLRCVLSCIITFIFASLVVRIGVDLMFQSIEVVSTDTTRYSIFTIGALNTIIGLIISALIFVSSRISGNIAGVAASSAIQGGMTAFAAGATRLSAAAGGRGISTTMQGGRNLKRNVSASVANRAKLAEANQQAAIERVKQANLND